jgi:uncharacterized protein YhfF
MKIGNKRIKIGRNLTRIGRNSSRARAMARINEITKEALNPMAIMLAYKKGERDFSLSNYFRVKKMRPSYPAIQFIKKDSRLICCRRNMNN